jgi:uncharacterized damage-inducible protein DinB
MTLGQMLIPELDHEMATTRRVLERVPEEKLTWKPHDKSMSLGRLAAHMAEIPALAQLILKSPSFDITSPRPSTQAATRQEILDLFDKNVAATRADLAAVDDAAMMEKWTLQRGEQTVFSLPRVAVLRSMVFSHAVHHRGQLSVYLRLNDVPVPSIYGPSADEMM